MHAHAKEEEPEAEARTKGQSSFTEASFPIIRAWRSAYSACIQSSIYSRRTHRDSAWPIYLPEGRSRANIHSGLET